MRLATHGWSLVLLASFVVCSGLAAAQGPADRDRVPRFPEPGLGQTVGEAVGYWTRSRGHPIHIADAKNGELRPIVGPDDLSLTIQGNHDKYPADLELQAGDLIGVVVYPMSSTNKLLECLRLVLAALAAGLLLGFLFGRRIKKRA